jgi:molybdopterin molybdotransferase
MMTVLELRSRLAQFVQPLPPLPLPLNEALGRFLAQPLLAPSDEPAFDRSAMDGYAVPADSSPGRFRVVAKTQPGEPAAPAPLQGEAVRVLTGSALPPGVRVVMQEDVQIHPDHLLIPSISGPTHVRLRGSALKAGDPLLQGKLSPAALALLASAGIASPTVHRTPTVAHLTTGREIIPAHAVPGPGQIRDSNGPLIRALVTTSGGSVCFQEHVLEEVAPALELCRQPLVHDADVLLVSGGASVGPHDHSAELLQNLGFDLICQRIDCRPGKPLIAGIRGRQLAFALPGNPVSHFVTFHLFVKPVLRRLLGGPWPEFQRVTLRQGLIEPNPRETFWPARASHEVADALPWLDSGHLAALLPVNALLRIPPNTTPTEGATLEMIPCD